MLGIVEDTSSKDIRVKERNELLTEEVEDEEFEEEEEEEEEEEPRVGYKPRFSIHLPNLPPLPENYPLHAAVIRKDDQALMDAIKALPPCTDPLVPLRSRPINALDHHGYTALTLSVLTSWMEGVKILLAYGASPSVTSLEGWTSIQEAVSTSQREILRMLIVANMKIVKENLTARASIIREQLKQKHDFYMEIDWKFTSWIPFVSRFCPSDTFRIWKKGCDVRIDISLIDFNQYRWERGHISFIFKTLEDGTVELHVLNHVNKTREKTTRTEELKTEEKDIDNSVEVLMQSEVITPELVTVDSQVKRNKNWLGHPKDVSVNGVDCRSFTVSNLLLLARRRNSHVPDEVKETLNNKAKILKETANASTNDNTSTSSDINATDNLGSVTNTSEVENTASSSTTTTTTTEGVSGNEPNASSQQQQDSSVAVDAFGKPVTSSGPFAGKKEQLVGYVKKYDYPKWNPPMITIEQYFNPNANSSVTTNANANVNTSETTILTKEKEKEKTLFSHPIDAAKATGEAIISKVFKKRSKKRKDKEKTTQQSTDSTVGASTTTDTTDTNVNANRSDEDETDKEWENSITRNDEDEDWDEFDRKSIFRRSTFVINPAPVKKTMKTFKLKLALSDKFGLTVEEMISILDAAAPTSKLAKKLKEFLEIQMPSGFPVQLQLPLYHVLKATVTFQNFKETDISCDTFDIPQGYILVQKENVSSFEDED